MKKFAFSLERVLEFRTHLQESEKMALAALQAHHNRLCAERDRMTAALSALGRKYEALCRQGTEVREIRALVTYIEELRRQIEEQKRAIEESRKKVERQTKIVIEANKDKRGLEILRDKQAGIYQAQGRREEERFIEEFVTAAGLSVI